MSTAAPEVRTGRIDGDDMASPLASVRAYFACDSRRVIQTVLGILWLLDGGLQFQSFMYGKGFVQMLTGMAAGQPGWLHDSISWGAGTMQSGQAVFNTLFALTQVLIGLGFLYRRTVKQAIAFSCLWAFIVWWFGEGFGMLLMTMAAPLTGAPGAAILYPLVGLLVWPGERPGGLLCVSGARTMWALLWVLMGWLWLEAPSSAPNAISGAIDAAPSGMSWLSTVQYWVADRAAGSGLAIALVLALSSFAIAAAVAMNWRPRPFLALAVVLNLAYWVLGQGFGGIFQGGATDPNAGPLFVLLAYALHTLVPYRLPASSWELRWPSPVIATSSPGNAVTNPNYAEELQ